MQLKVTRIQLEAHNIKSFELRQPDGAAMPAFTAGSHVHVNVINPDGKADTRQYSLASDPADTSRYEIAVLLEATGCGGSEYMHTKVSEGSMLEVSQPINEFPISATGDHAILIAGGIGITPILSMIYALNAAGRSYELHYAARTPKHMAYQSAIEAVAGSRAKFYFTSTVTRMEVGHLLATPKAATHIYFCGPNRLIDQVKGTAEAKGWKPEQIHFESFGARWETADQPVEVTLSMSGLTFMVQPGQTILEAIEASGAWSPWECRRGECGTCATVYTAGTPVHRDSCLTPADHKHTICTCVSWAKGGKLVLDL